MRKYLLVSRVGCKSLHDAWISGTTDRNYDVMLSCYDPSVDVQAGDGLYVEHRPGRKVEGYNAFLEERPDIWKRYSYICLMDEDIEADISTLNAMFDLCARHNLKIAQPALTQDSHFTYAAFLQQPQWRLRYSTFIEMMCPVFRKDVLEVTRSLYAMGFESGIDLIWCNAVYEAETDFAILDATPVRHTEPVGGNKAANGFIGGKRYEDDIGSILRRYDLPWLPCVPYAALTRAGGVTNSKVCFVWSALMLWPAAARQKPIKGRMRSIAVHLNHLLRRKPLNIKVSLEKP